MSKEEVVTREWTMPDGARAALLKFKAERIRGRGTVAVAEYGSKSTGLIACVDIYQYREAPPPSGARLLLLCHDARPGWLTDLRVEYGKGGVLFRFTRERPPEGAGGAVRNSYSYQYDESSGFSETLGDFYWKVDAGSAGARQPPLR